MLLLYDSYSRGPVVLLSRWRTQSDQSESAGVYSCTVNEIRFLLSTSTSNLKEINGNFFFVKSSEINNTITDNLFFFYILHSCVVILVKLSWSRVPDK